MKLQCQVEVVNRLHSNLNVKSSGKYLKSTLALGREPKCENEYFILHFSSVNKTGVKYRVKFMKKVFVRCLNEGKVTLRFEEPPHDLCVKSEAIQLRCFMKLLKQCVTGEAKELKALSNVSVLPNEMAPTKLVVRNRAEYPAKGLPRTLQSLSLAGLGMCNFRRDILLLRSLSTLDLSNNEIEKLPAEFGCMPNLAELHLANNLLGIRGNVDWKWLFGPQIRKSLRLLDLTNNALVGLPKAVWKLQALATLRLDHNRLKRLPTTLGRITTLRYLTVPNNCLAVLPCGLLQCQLEHLDVSSNPFQPVTPNRAKNVSPWKYVAGNLVQIAAKVVLKNKFYYAPDIIPFTLVEYLDDANLCVCGAPVTNQTDALTVELNIREYFRSVVFNNYGNGRIGFEGYFCSQKCLRRDSMDMLVE